MRIFSFCLRLQFQSNHHVRLVDQIEKFGMLSGYLGKIVLRSKCVSFEISQFKASAAFIPNSKAPLFMTGKTPG